MTLTLHLFYYYYLIDVIYNTVKFSFLESRSYPSLSSLKIKASYCVVLYWVFFLMLKIKLNNFKIIVDFFFKKRLIIKNKC